MASTNARRIKLKAQIMTGDTIAFGPGKADLLDAIISEGSISAAGRKLGMSYRRAWLLVTTMNGAWDAPLVITAAGNHQGAEVTDFGRRVLAEYRTMERAIGHAAATTANNLLSHVVGNRP